MFSEDFDSVVLADVFESFVDKLADLQKAVRELTQDHLHQNEKIRLVGVRVSSLKSINGQRTLL